jgi:hypothetical protein
MNYPVEFKNKAKRLYPTWNDLHKMLDAGQTFAGRYLDDASSSTMSLNDILSAKSLDDLQNKARIEMEKNKLYIEWCELYHQQFG